MSIAMWMLPVVLGLASRVLRMPGAFVFQNVGAVSGHIASNR
jgi:hypothetical protein